MVDTSGMTQEQVAALATGIRSKENGLLGWSFLYSFLFWTIVFIITTVAVAKFE